MNSKLKAFCTIICLLMLFWSHHITYAQQPISQQAFTIFEQHCLDCHGEFGSYSDVLTIKHKDLIEDRSVIPGQPDASELYLRLLGDTDNGSQMPLGQELLDSEAIATIRRWIEAGAPDWEAIPKPKRNFITTEAMLQTIHTHVTSLTTFDRSFARYFTLTHLYNAGASDDNLRAYRNALSKLVNSLSWGAEVIKPTPIDNEETIFYIDLRHYEWDIKSDKWYKIEQAYPYGVQLKSSTWTTLCEETNCELPFVRADWFIATASLPPLYHDILGLPETDKELETQLEVNVAENLKNAPGVRVWRAGFNESGVSANNRIVERHKSRYGAYWKSYDFAGNVGTQNIFTHPLDFTHDGGEIIFNLPNGLQAYYLSTATGERLDEAPINIVSDAGSRDPVVRNGLSCMGCHTEGMKTFEDQIRSVIEQNLNPSYDKAQALRLYVEKSEMDSLVREDIARYRRAIEAAGGVFGGSEPIQKLVKQFEGPLDATHAAAEVGLETADFLQKIREDSALQNAGLLVLGVGNGTVKRDAWESEFGTVDSVLQSRVNEPERPVPGEAPHMLEDLVVPPKYKTQVKPNYPKEAQQAQKEGTVILQATIDVNGIPQDIVSSTNLGFGLEEAAIEALKKTTFHPATQGGKPIRRENVQIPYEFQLKPSNIANTDMVLIPAGEFQIGSNNDGDEPVHTVYVGEFYMDKYEVTNAQYKVFVDANPEWRKEIVHQKHGGSTYLNNWAGDNCPNGKKNHPVTMVSWDAAMAYAKWVGKRLPTEAEWEKAARGGLTGKKYPWGNSIDASKANYGKSLDSDGTIKTTPVGSYPANGYGLYDMVGNVQEWCLDEYDGRVYSKSPALRVSRGGGWYYEAHEVRIANRNASSPLMTLVDYGFRCVRSEIIFKLVESIKFADGTEVKSITKDDIDALRDRPIRLGENDHLDGVMLTNEKDERIHARTCREYDSAIKRGYDTYTTFDIKMSVWFKHHCGLLNALEGAAVPQRSYISNPKVGITNLDLIPFSLFPNLSGDEIDLGATFEKKIRNGELIVIEKDQNVLTTEGIGMEQLLREVVRADFNNDGIEDILLFEYHYATQGTLGFGGVIVLTRKSMNGKFEVVRPPNSMQSSVHPYWSD